MYSSEGERVQLIQNISTSEAKGAVEKWLVQVEDMMLQSIRDVVARSRLVRSLFPFANMYSSEASLACTHFGNVEVISAAKNSCKKNVQ